MLDPRYQGCLLKGKAEVSIGFSCHMFAAEEKSDWVANGIKRLGNNNGFEVVLLNNERLAMSGRKRFISIMDRISNDAQSS